MKIIVDARSLGSNPSGIGMYLYDFLIEMNKQPDFKIILLSDVVASEQIWDLHDRGITIIPYGTKISQSIHVFRYFQFVHHALDYHQPDLFWEPNNLIPIPLKWFSGKILVTIHDVFPLTQPENHGHLYPFYFRYGLKQTMKQADFLTYNSKETKHEVETLFPKAKTLKQLISYIIIKKPAPAVSYSSDTLFPNVPIDGEDYFLYLGNLEKRKGTDLLLKAYQLYQKNGGTKKLYLGGKIREPEIQKLYDEIHKDTPGILSLGYVSDEQKAALFQNCAGFLFPSRAEGFGIPIIEAMHYNKPILASSLSIFQEIAGDAITYYDCSGTDDMQVQKLADAMLHLKAADSNAYSEVRSRYLPERLGPVFCQFIRSTLSPDSIPTDSQEDPNQNND